MMIHFCQMKHKVLIRKAKRRAPWKKTRTYNRVLNLSKTMGSAVKIDLVKGLIKFKSKINPERIYEAWLTTDWSKVMHTIPWNDLHSDMSDARDALGKSIMASARVSSKALPAPVQTALRYDVNNQRIQRFLDKRVGEMIVNPITQDAQKIIMNAVARSWSESMSPREIADQIKDSIGLYPKLENAVYNYRDGLKKSGMPYDKVQELTGKYNDRLVDYRAMMIARTETRTATNYGQLYVWQEASNQDLIDRNSARKVWVVDGDPCEICEPMDGVAVGLAEAWTIEDTGDVVDVPNEVHPHCYCGMELDFGDSADRPTPEEYNEE